MLQKTPKFVAAVDLGSNSFHLIVCSLKQGKIKKVDALKEIIRLDFLNKKNMLTQPAQERALACLERFGQRLHNLPSGSVRVVGTNVLRNAKKSVAFINKAQRVLGHPLHIISGAEEARLIYQGVTHDLQGTTTSRLVIDIGGGSTEYIIGIGHATQKKASLNMGCVAMSQQFFKKGKISNKRLQKAILHAKQMLGPLQQGFNCQHWQEAVGASGTLRAVEQILRTNKWSNNGITLSGLQKLIDYLIAQKNSNNLHVTGIDPARLEVLSGGVAIIYASFIGLKITQMTVVSGALREGLIIDLAKRKINKDIRNDSVKTLASYYHTNTQHSTSIKQTISLFLAQLEQNKQQNLAGEWLYWAADLHEIGRDIAHSKYHKHGAYIVEHTDLPGFSKPEQKLLAVLLACHRCKLKKNSFAALLPPWDKQILLLTLLLRLAILLHRNHSDNAFTALKINIKANACTLHFAEGWLKKSPLTNADLNQEAKFLTAIGFSLYFA